MSFFLSKKNDSLAQALVEFYERVIEWNKVAGNDYSLSELYGNLVREEIRELNEAKHNEDAVEYVKELADCLVVGSYYALCKGMSEEELLGIVGAPNDDSFEEFRNWLKYESEEDLITVFEKFDSDVLIAFEDIYYNTDADMASVLNEVMDSNFSKFIDAHEATTAYGGDMEKVCRQIEEESGGRYTGVNSQYSNGYIVFRDSKGKIVKPPCYRAADVGKYVPAKWEISLTSG